MYPVVPNLLIVIGRPYDIEPETGLTARTCLKLPEYRGHFYLEDILLRPATVRPPTYPITPGDRMNHIGTDNGSQVQLLRTKDRSQLRGHAAQEARERRSLRNHLNAWGAEPNEALQATQQDILAGIPAPLQPAFDSAIQTVVQTLAWLQISSQITLDEQAGSYALLAKQFDDMALQPQSLPGFFTPAVNQH
ncbi:hypothetical protein ACFSM5_07805 [Lacibacterium aquatile]|uniref:Uncharacterized protein n=1 Tax=Lacibacterium aquatile TaxID=1168082 RepID=A0ABW5DPD2_9PROT